MKELEVYRKQATNDDINDLANGTITYEEFRNNIIISNEGGKHSDAVETMIKMVQFNL
jgi:hypothetical protein